MLRCPTCAVIALLAFGAVGCDSGRRSAAGFRLPDDGSVERGKAAFVALECSKCHRVAGVDLPSPTVTPSVPVVLGGAVTREPTDGSLVASIINPSHVIQGYPRERVARPDGKSRMPEYTDNITVRQLADIVAFLQSRYEVRPPARGYPALN